jgi:hypothetical protein
MSDHPDNLDKLVADAVADGRLTSNEAAHVLKFRDFLRLMSPPPRPGAPTNTLTPEQRAANRRVLQDPEWREWLRLPPLEAADAEPATEHSPEG